jgi:hypothetical protein
LAEENAMSDTPAPADPPDPGAVELLRAWVVGAELHCSLQLGAVPDLATWGAVLADVAKHLALALQQQEGKDPSETLRLLREAFEQGLADGPP